MSNEELIDFHESKMENFYRTVEIMIKGWEKCSFNSLQEKKKFEQFLNGLKYLLYDRKLSLETLFEFKIGFGEELYRNEDNFMQRVVSIYYPMYAPEDEGLFLFKHSEVKLVKMKSRGLFPGEKKFQRMIPSGAGFGVFGLNTLKDKFNAKKSKKY